MSIRKLQCEFNREACIEAVNNLHAEIQVEANVTGFDIEVQYQIEVITKAGVTQYYKLNNGTPAKITEAEYGILTAVAETLNTTEESLEVIIDLETEIEPITEETVTFDKEVEVETLKAEIERLRVENEELKEKLNAEPVNESLLVKYANDAKKAFQALDELNASFKNYR